jgi:DNA-binding winged helix-turn-helix (wHTH) protein
MRFTFGEFVLDCGTRQLLRGGREAHASPKELALLEQLLRARPRAVSRTRLRAAIWPDAHVGETSLHVLVSQLRATLADDANEPRFVRTVAGFGYAFAGSAVDEGGDEGAARRQLWLESDAGPIVLAEGEYVLGRDEALVARVDGPGVSRRHARVLVRAGRATLEDLDSKNGTFVDGERVSSSRVLRDGALIRLGRRASLVFRDDAADPTETEASDD